MNTMTWQRYIKRNATNISQKFWHIDYKKQFLSEKKVRFLIALVARKIVYKMTLPDSYRIKIRKSYATANYRKRIQGERKYYLLPLFLAHRFLLTFALAMPLREMVFIPYVSLRYFLGKVDIPYFELVLTTRCTMRCESCANLMQYFDSKNTYTCSLEKILESLQVICNLVDSITYVRIIGGEPLLFKDIAKVAQALQKEPKIKSFDIVTNGTIIPNDELLSILSESHKSWISISDYSASPNLKVKLRTPQIIQKLQEYNVRYELLWQDSTWFDPGRVYKRNRDKAEIIRNFRACMKACVSVMSNENFAYRGNEGGGQEQSFAHQSLDNNTPLHAMRFSEARENPAMGHIFICPIASSLSRLKGLEEFKGDFITLDSQTSKADFRKFYAQDYFKACDYCDNMWEHRKDIPIAIQTKKVLPLAPE